jgi:hypothetical protein
VVLIFKKLKESHEEEGEGAMGGVGVGATGK